MKKIKQLQKIKEVYAKGGNIIQYLKSIDGNETRTTIEDIMISYDFQAGSYIKQLSENPEFKLNYCSAIARIIDKLENVDTIIEVGVGEATTLGVLAKKLNTDARKYLGFDISWSRLKFGSDFIADLNLSNVELFVANLFEIPLKDSSIDVVYTSHSIEPNGGKEEEALKELYRITKKYLILLEPSFEFANEEARNRMKHHGYVTKLYETAVNLGMNVVEHRLFDYSANPLNPTGLMIIEKQEENTNTSQLVCPITFTDLEKINGSMLYAKESGLTYPIISNIPVLLKENSILATHMHTDYELFKKENNLTFNID